MRKYEAKPTCDKCGGDNIELDYHDEDAHYIPCCTDVDTEHLSLACEGCGYRWYTATKDADATPEGKVLEASTYGLIEKMVAAADALRKASKTPDSQQVTHDIGTPPEQQGVLTSTGGDDYTWINADDTAPALVEVVQVANEGFCYALLEGALRAKAYCPYHDPCGLRCFRYGSPCEGLRVNQCIDEFGLAGVWMAGKKDTE